MVTYTDVGPVTINGGTGSIMTADVMNGGLDGSIGPVAGADQADGCFGFGPELTIRTAVISHNKYTVLIWARTNGNLVDRMFLAQFETMLRSIKWRS